MMKNVRVLDNGAAFCVVLDGMIIEAFSTLGSAWNHIAWMHRVASQEFTVGENKIPVKEWIEAGIHYGWLNKDVGFHK